MDVVVVAGAIAGVALHQLFKRREPTSTGAILTVAGVDAALAVLLRDRGVVLGRLVVVLSGTTVAALFLSIAAYRLAPWHPLTRYPGPALYKLSKLRVAWSSWRGTHYKAMAALHAKYGPVVRMGPNAVSISDVAAVSAVYGANGLPKGRYYVSRAPPGNGSLIVLNGIEHAQRRRLWNRGLGASALETHTRCAAVGWERLREQLDKAVEAQRVVDVSMWMRLYGFDFMGNFAFGKDFGLVVAGKDSIGVWKTILNFLVVHDIVGHVPWLGWRASFMPGLVNKLMKLRNFSRKCVEDRLKRPATTLDLWYYLSAEAEDDKSAEPLRVDQQAAEGSLALIAGADTSASTMVSTVFMLIAHPDCMAKARAEVDAAAAHGHAPWASADGHAELPYLTACMDETLRLLPVIATNGSRCVPRGSGGRTIAGHFIPEDTEVHVAPYQLQRDPRYFAPHTASFCPERWLDAGEAWTTNREAFIPFSAGPAQCVGKALARIEIVLVLSGLLRCYDMAFAPGFAPDTYSEHIEEHIVSDVPPLPVTLTRRDVG